MSAPTKEPLFTVVCDTREQLPLAFPGIATVCATLRTGDYSLRGFENRVCCERKSLNDCWSSMTIGRARFERCVKRMSEMERACIVIEGSLSQLVIPPPYIKSVNAASVVGGLISWSVQYNIPIFFADNRDYSARIVLRYLAAFWKHRRDNGSK